MSGEDATLAVIDALEAGEIPYLLVGSFSSNYYGVPRSTEDADFVVHLGETRISVLIDRLGPRFRLNRQMSFETITGTTRWEVEVSDIPFKIELFLLSDDPHDQERFRRRRRVRVFGRETYLPTPEDVIITKLRWARQGARPKDRDDVRNVIAVQGDRLDWDYLCQWCDCHGTGEALREIQASIPPI